MPLVLCCVPMLGLVDFLCVAFEVCIDDEWHRQLPLRVLEHNFLLLQFLWKFDSLSLLLETELRMSVKKALSAKTMEAVVTVELATVMLGSISH